MALTLLNLEQPPMKADGSTALTTVPPGSVALSDIAGMEQFFVNTRTASGQNVTPEKAKRCAAVLACMRGISEDLCALPLPLYKRGENGDDIAADHPVHRILNVAPNEVMTPIELREHMIFDLMLKGAFFNLKNEDPNKPGVLGSVWPLDASYVTRHSFALVWTFSDPTTNQSGEFTPDLVWRGSLLSGNGIDGTAITLLAREAIGLLLAAEEQGARLFSQGVQTDLALSSEDAMDDEQKQQLRAAFMARHSGSSNAWLPLLLEGGLKANKLGLTAQESQYIEARKFQIEDIARVFRYPEVLLGSTGGKSSTYASAEQFFMSYTKHTLLPWAVRIEQTINRDLLTTKEQAKYYARHDFDQLLRADQNARFTAWNLAVAGGWMQPAEARRKEGLPYKPGLDYFAKAQPGLSTTNGATPAVPNQ